MSPTDPPYPNALPGDPVYPPYPPAPPARPLPPPPPRRSVFGTLMLVFSLLSGLFLLLVCGGFLLLPRLMGGGDSTGPGVQERYYAGKTGAKDKIAVVRVDGVIAEGATQYVEKQIEQAAGDKQVKAVVLRINSPGGTITATDQVYRKLLQLRDGESGKAGGKPLVVSMGSIAASGGYYIAMPGKKVFAEPTTITGSIGVYAMFPNVEGLAKKYEVEVKVIKAGDVKDSGSLFKSMKPDEEQMWQNMVDHSYLQFLQVVEKGRPELKGKLQEDIKIQETLQVRDHKDRQRTYDLTRYRADGGIFTAKQARQYGLIDEEGYLDKAIDEAKKQASLGEDYKVVMYDRPLTLLGALLGVKAPEAPLQLDAGRLADGAVPKLWYLSPQCEAAGLVATVGR